MTTAEIIAFFITKGFTVTTCFHDGRVVVNVRSDGKRCSFGSGGETVEIALRNAYEHGSASFGNFTTAEIEEHYRQAFERSTGRNYRETFGMVSR